MGRLKVTFRVHLHLYRMLILIPANCLNIAFALYGAIVQPESFPNHSLFVFLGNLAIYLLYYILMKVIHREHFTRYAIVFLLLAIGFWASSVCRVEEQIGPIRRSTRISSLANRTSTRNWRSAPISPIASETFFILVSFPVPWPRVSILSIARWTSNPRAVWSTIFFVFSACTSVRSSTNINRVPTNNVWSSSNVYSPFGLETEIKTIASPCWTRRSSLSNTRSFSERSPRGRTKWRMRFKNTVQWMFHKWMTFSKMTPVPVSWTTPIDPSPNSFFFFFPADQQQQSDRWRHGDDLHQYATESLHKRFVLVRPNYRPVTHANLRDVFLDWAKAQCRIVDNESPGSATHKLMFPEARYPRKTCFRPTRFSLVPGQPMRFRGFWAAVSCSSHRTNPGKRVSGELDFHWFPVDQWVFEVNEPQSRIPHIELPTVASKVVNTCLLSGNVLLTRLQTDRQTDRQTNIQTYLIS